MWREKIVFLGALVFCTLYVNHVMASQWGHRARTLQKTTTTDTLPGYAAETMKIHKIENGENIEMSFENGQLRKLKINGENIPEEDFDKYKDKTGTFMPKTGSFPFRSFFLNGDMDESLEKWFGSGWKNLDSLFNEYTGPTFQFFQNPDHWKGLNNLNGEFWNEQMQILEEYFNSEDFSNMGEDTLFRFRFGGPFMSENPKDRHEEYIITPDSDDNFTEILGSQLNRDELLIPGKVNKIELTGKYLKINGEKQPSNIWSKYKHLFEESSGTLLQKNSKIIFDYRGIAPKRKYRNL